MGGRGTWGAGVKGREAASEGKEPCRRQCKRWKISMSRERGENNPGESKL